MPRFFRGLGIVGRNVHLLVGPAIAAVNAVNAFCAPRSNAATVDPFTAFSDQNRLLEYCNTLEGEEMHEAAYVHAVLGMMALFKPTVDFSVLETLTRANGQRIGTDLVNVKGIKMLTSDYAIETVCSADNNKKNLRKKLNNQASKNSQYEPSENAATLYRHARDVLATLGLENDNTSMTSEWHMANRATFYGPVFRAFFDNGPVVNYVKLLLGTIHIPQAGDLQSVVEANLDNLPTAMVRILHAGSVDAPITPLATAMIATPTPARAPSISANLPTLSALTPTSARTGVRLPIVLESAGQSGTPRVIAQHDLDTFAAIYNAGLASGMASAAPAANPNNGLSPESLDAIRGLKNLNINQRFEELRSHMSDVGHNVTEDVNSHADIIHAKEVTLLEGIAATADECLATAEANLEIAAKAKLAAFSAKRANKAHANLDAARAVPSSGAGSFSSSSSTGSSSASSSAGLNTNTSSSSLNSTPRGKSTFPFKDTKSSMAKKKSNLHGRDH